LDVSLEYFLEIAGAGLGGDDDEGYEDIGDDDEDGDGGDSGDDDEDEKPAK